MTKADGSLYDTDYSNIEYVSSNSGQTWTATPPILLTGTKANVYAYYPYNSSYRDITQIPINVTENKDVMWATPATNIYNANPTAPLSMNHALSVIRLSLSKGDYSGAGSIESITIQGDCMAKTGTLNAKTGDLTATDGGTEIELGDLGAATTLSETATTVEQLVIPTGSAGSIQVTVKMDGKTFEATSSAAITPEQSKAYKFGLSFTDSKLTMSTVSIGTISEEDLGSMTPIVDSGSAWSKFTTENDGVYGIDADGKPLTFDEASSASSLSGVAIVMYGRALQISNSELTDQRWGSTSVNISGIPDMTKAGGGLTNSFGYLPYPDGSYFSENYQIKEGYENWPNYTSTALADTCGWQNTEALIKEQTNSAYLGPKTKAFREGTLSGVDNQGYSDWYIPACGQLAYIYLKKSEINTLLQKVTEAKQIWTHVYYWSSSEDSSNYAWHVSFSNGDVYDNTKSDTSSRYVRFCRYLN